MPAERGSLKDKGYNWLLLYKIIYKNIAVIYLIIPGELKIVKEVEEVAFNLIKELIYIVNVAYLKRKYNQGINAI